MKQSLKELLTKIFGVVKGFPTRMTDESNIRVLLKNLYPLSTDKELIRLGPKTDGGYLVPNDLEGIQACFSPGVSFVSGFEKDCAELGMKVFLADQSVDRPADEHKLFNFTKKYVGAISNDHFMTLDEWVASSLTETNSDLLLQIDIEGYEYEVFLSTSENLMQRFRIIVAEFHSLDQLWNGPFFNLARSTFNKILQTHKCIHIHPNNCHSPLQKKGINIPRTMEFTFLRIDRIEHSSYQNKFPNSLDYDNTANPSLVLPKCWYSEE
ncbi:MAG: hypothetical protein F6K40_17865 [Okeania sp. SIO3I5]|uniref:FkbM family methyltransferase n=1 Tax=Okeania sp. SIO3I5 TaxID=2607805 RepID=UPI0013BD8884|nr:FkbM family methyltransferase [Okeania sp. SIO3I5]NEQ38025.1 hypothetical protein [Okeania sp. SIO3I5]